MFKYASIQKAKTDEEFVEKVKKSRFPKSAKGAILELWQKGIKKAACMFGPLF